MATEQTTPQRPTAPPPLQPPSRPWLSALASGQEFGLLVVLLVMVFGLWLWTPAIQRSDRTPQEAGVTAVDSPAGGFTLKGPAPGESRAYTESDGYSYMNAGDRVVLVRTYSVNKFLNADNVLSVLTASSFIAVMAVGMTGIIVMGGIDLSVGSVYALAAVLGAMVLRQMQISAGDNPVPVWLAVPAGVAICGGVGAVCGLINGVATVGLRVHPFIITLGGMAVYRGIAFVTTEGQSIGQFPNSYVTGFFKSQIGGVTPIPLLVMLCVGVVGAFVLARTVFGRRTFAIGGNEVAARYAGVPVGRVKVMLFVICGALAGLSAAMMLGYYGAGASDAGKGYELSVIAATVVGGASLSGGRGSALGAVLGAIIIQLIDNSILMLNIDQNYKDIVIGLAIVIAVVVDQFKARISTGRR